MTRDEAFQLDQAHQLLDRLERLSADSIWAHRASGFRGSLLKYVDQIEIDRGKRINIPQKDWDRLKDLITRGFWMLEQAARQIPVDDSHQR